MCRGPMQFYSVIAVKACSVFVVFLVKERLNNKRCVITIRKATRGSQSDHSWSKKYKQAASSVYKNIMTEKQNVLNQLYNDTTLNKLLFVGHCEPDQAPLRMHSLRRTVPNAACWGHMQPRAVMKHFKSCLSALALLIVYDIFSEQACDVCLPTKLCKNVTKKTRLKKEPRFKCFSRKLGGAVGGGWGWFADPYTNTWRAHWALIVTVFAM